MKPEVAQTEQPTNEQPNEQAPEQPQGESPSSAEPQAPAENAEAPQEAPDDDGVDIPTFDVRPVASQPQEPQQPIEVKPLDPKDFTNESTGEVDTQAFAQAMTSRDDQLRQSIVQQVARDLLPQLTQQATQISSNQVMAAKREERQWEDAFKKYPTLKDSRDIRDTVHKIRVGEYQTQGHEITPKQAADRFFKFVNAAKAQGTKEATETVRVQASAHLETADNTASDRGLKTQRDLGNIDSTNRKVAEDARINVVKDMLARGVL